jgi:ubiquinone/menaquinone biosynthesis C-methylase UbiE
MTGNNVRHGFAGVVKILRFNWHFYALSAAGIAGMILLLASRLLPRWLELAVSGGAAIAVFWTLSSLLVSWYVYDYVGVTRWQWLRHRISAPLHRWANIHAGLDESTSSLRQLFPDTAGTAVDIYDAREMTEPSIARARRIHPSLEPFRQGKYDSLPLPENDCDAVFLLFAAHEVRAAQHRTLLLRETARVLRERGCVVLVEHLRDWKNFAAFGPGFLHFHSRQNWLRSIDDAGLVVEQAFPVTPFVECFVLRKVQP